MDFDALMIVLTVIAILSALFFFLALLADIFWPLIANRRQRPQATYKSRRV